VAGDAGAKVWERTSAIAAAAQVPDAGPPIIHRYLDFPNVNLAETALGALAWTGEPDTALPLLLAHIGDDRARVAVYAAGRVARFLPPSRLGTAQAGMIRCAVVGGAAGAALPAPGRARTASAAVTASPSPAVREWHTGLPPSGRRPMHTEHEG